MIFAFINKMKTSDSPPKYIHDEKNRMSDINFQFLERSAALDESESKAQLLGCWSDSETSNDCKVEELLYKEYATRVWRPLAIRKSLDMLSPSNCYIVHQSKNYAAAGSLRIEPIYGTHFKSEKIPDELMQDWATAMPREGEVLDYPPPNMYVPTRIPQQRKASRNEGDSIGKPIKLQGDNDGKSDVWFKQDDQFDQP